MNYSQSEIEREIEALQGANIFLERHGLKPLNDVSIAALEKQIQLYPENGNYCPKCGYRMLNRKQNYCGYCGQAIRRPG